MHWNWFDIVVTVMVVLGAVDGLRRGLITKAFDLVGLVIGLVVAARYYDVAARFLDRTFNLGTRFVAYLTAAFPDPLRLPQPGDPLYGLVTALGPQGAALTVDSLAASLVNALGFLLMLIATGIVVGLIKWPIARLLSHLLGGVVNRVLGLFFGSAVTVAELAVGVGLAVPFLSLASLRGLAAALSNSWSGGHLLAISQWILGYLRPLFPGGA